MIPCPICGQGYSSALGRAPATIIFCHPDGRECVHSSPECDCCGTSIVAGAACYYCITYHECDAGTRHPAFKQPLSPPT
jgi:hypothetical protein